MEIETLRAAQRLEPATGGPWSGREVRGAALQLLGMELGHIASPAKTRHVNMARMWITGAIKHLTTHSWPEIAVLMCRRRHSSCLTQYQRFMAMPEDQRSAWLVRLADAMNRVRTQLGGWGGNIQTSKSPNIQMAMEGGPR